MLHYKTNEIFKMFPYSFSSCKTPEIEKCTSVLYQLRILLSTYKYMTRTIVKKYLKSLYSRIYFYIFSNCTQAIYDRIFFEAAGDVNMVTLEISCLFDVAIFFHSRPLLKYKQLDLDYVIHLLQKSPLCALLLLSPRLTRFPIARIFVGKICIRRFF